MIPASIYISEYKYGEEIIKINEHLVFGVFWEYKKEPPRRYKLPFFTRISN